jgi:hypothetical protein
MKKVNVIGGGVAGISAAHELIERGYAVEVYERNHQYAGGKARCIDYYNRTISPKAKLKHSYHTFCFTRRFYGYVINCTKMGLVHKYIYIAEGILMISIPTLFNRRTKPPQWLNEVLGFIQALINVVVSFISLSLFNK